MAPEQDAPSRVGRLPTVITVSGRLTGAVAPGGAAPRHCLVAGYGI